ncbi:MAG: hypothetical protein JW807_15150 [Spirochaetes bacterium]|nr:hypothetical protein [Spirochaetota bacterium]
MKMLLCGLIVVFCSAAAIPAEDRSPDEWKKINQTKDGIVIYTRIVTDSPIREVKSTYTIESPPRNVWQALLDKETYRDSNKYVEVDTVYRTANENVWYNYQKVAPPLMKKRDYTLRYESMNRPEKMQYKLVWAVAGDFGPPPEKGVLRLSVCDGWFTIEPRDGGKRSFITYWLCFDPGGQVPPWAANLANRSSVPDFLRKIRDRSFFWRDQQNSGGK